MTHPDSATSSLKLISSMVNINVAPAIETQYKRRDMRLWMLCSNVRFREVTWDSSGGSLITLITIGVFTLDSDHGGLIVQPKVRDNIGVRM